MSKQPFSSRDAAVAAAIEKPKCGLVMPIATFGDYPQSHWTSVESILREALEEIGFEAKLVSQETTSGVIHQRIITNLYTNDIVVCDVSARNPNVMFELGMRLAFDKPTVIIKDDETPFSFDISAIEHLTYPRSLKYAEIVKFKRTLGEYVISTSNAAKADSNYSTFLKHITGVRPAKLNVQEVPFQEFISKQLDEIRSQIEGMKRSASPIIRDYSTAATSKYYSQNRTNVILDLTEISEEKLEVIMDEISKKNIIIDINRQIASPTSSAKAVFTIFPGAGNANDLMRSLVRQNIDPSRIQIEVM